MSSHLLANDPESLERPVSPVKNSITVVIRLYGISVTEDGWIKSCCIKSLTVSIRLVGRQKQEVLRAAPVDGCPHCVLDKPHLQRSTSSLTVEPSRWPSRSLARLALLSSPSSSSSASCVLRELDFQSKFKICFDLERRLWNLAVRFFILLTQVRCFWCRCSQVRLDLGMKHLQLIFVDTSEFSGQHSLVALLLVP